MRDSEQGAESLTDRIRRTGRGARDCAPPVAAAAGELYKKNVELAVPLEQSGLEKAEELLHNIERWLEPAPDSVKWSMEDSSTEESGGATGGCKLSGFAPAGLRGPAAPPAPPGRARRVAEGAGLRCAAPRTP